MKTKKALKGAEEVTRTWPIWTLVRHWKTEELNNVGQPYEKQEDTAVFDDQTLGDQYILAALADGNPSTFDLRDQSVAFDPQAEPDRLKLPLNPVYQPISQE